MTQYSTGQNGPATQDLIFEAYLRGVQRGIAYGAVMAMTPAQKDLDGYRASKKARRLEAYYGRRPRKRDRFWPDDMPGGWPLPSELPSDNPADWWHEDPATGWPCPPPALRGPA